MVLAWAGADPTCGAGIQADLLTLSSLGCYATTVITALTAQDTLGVHKVAPVPPDLVRDQSRVLTADVAPDAFKLGMLGSRDNAIVIGELLSDLLATRPDRPVVLDPVLASGRGDALADDDLVQAIRRVLLPHTTVITPNTIEARTMAGLDADAPLADCAAQLIDYGAKFVLITGTHAPTERVVNTLYDASGAIQTIDWERLPESYHGSGCTLAAAITALLANGLAIDEAVREAQDYTWQSLVNAHTLGAGQALPDRFFWARHVAAAGS